MTAPRGSIDEICVNTIRTLCIDAVQQAKSGHPGTPMAMAPVVYTLWQEFLRFDPEDPIWPNRDRFVLSSGHASILLYSMLHLTGVKAVDEKYERLGTPTVALDDLKHFRQLDSKCPGHPEYHLTSGVETTTGPLGQGVATSVGMAIAADWLARHFNRPGLHVVRLRRLRAVRRRLHDGGRRQRGGLARRPSAARQPLLDLRQQPHHDRGQHRARLQRGCRRPVSRLWLARAAGQRRQRPRADRRGDRDRQAHRRPAEPDHRRRAISATARRTSRTPRAPTASRWARKRSSSTKRAYGWPEDAKFLVPDGVYEHFAENFGARGKKLRAEWMALFERYRSALSGARRSMRADAAARAARGLGQGHPGLPGRSRRASPAATRRARC